MANVLDEAQQAIQTINQDAQAAKWYGIVSLALLLYVAVRVSKR